MAMPRRTGSAPAATTWAAIDSLLLSGIEAGPSGCPDRAELVAGGDDGHARLAVHLHAGVPGGRQRCHRGRADTCAGRQQRITPPDVAADLPDVRPDPGRLPDGYARRQHGGACRSIRILDGHDRIGSGREDGPGEDTDGCAGHHLDAGFVPGGDLSGHPQPDRCLRRCGGRVLAADREAIHGAVVPGWQGQQCHRIDRQHAPQRLRERHGLRSQGQHVREDAGLRLLETQQPSVSHPVEPTRLRLPMPNGRVGPDRPDVPWSGPTPRLPGPAGR